MTKRLCLPVLLLVTVLMSGCFFDNPLTAWPSKNLNTWLLGVWQSTDEQGKIATARVQPMANSRYAVRYEVTNKDGKNKKTWLFEAWIARVGSASFLNFKCVESAGEVPAGAFVFLHYQVVAQNTIVTRMLQIDSPREATSYQLRQEVRQKLKDKTLYQGSVTVWKRTSEVYWSDDPYAPQPPQPLRFPND